MTLKPHIVDYIGHHAMDDKLYLFMGLKMGNLADLLHGGAFQRTTNLLTTVCFHVLKGLDFLSNENILHRDLKPENILYTVSNDGQDYTFMMGDFGLCNVATNASTYAGTPLFMAPEIMSNDGQNQTTKVDVWSLFATLAWVAMPLVSVRRHSRLRQKLSMV